MYRLNSGKGGIGNGLVGEKGGKVVGGEHCKACVGNELEGLLYMQCYRG